ncbi:MAG: M23 family metallopeptidase [Oscillospiraceae bacterium]|nr:M23 family metallopeptidase [Oscillospiraceae bacterium]
MKQIWSNVGRWLEGKGFYIVLFLCLAAIGISGYFLFTTFQRSSEVISPTLEDESVPQAGPSPEQEILPSEDAASAMGEAQMEEDGESVLAEPSDEGDGQEEAQAGQEEKASVDLDSLSFVWPVSGEILTDFSVETLAYDVTMGDWRVHSGVDIAAALGTQVCAIAAGTVERVVQDEMMGVTVVVDHGDGLTSTYCNLAEELAVTVGDQVQAGDALGSVGSTALAESALEPHLHLEVALNQATVNPLDYLPEGE